jgi:hypothetical protein
MENKTYNFNDPLKIVHSKVSCDVCHDDRKLRKNCTLCGGSGHPSINLNGLWYPSPAFLVCGGPSINKLPFQRLGERGIASLAVNQIAAYVPVSAWCFSDPQSKFHHGMFLDPKCITFAPTPKLRRNVTAKMPDGSFRQMDVKLKNAPATFGFERKTMFNASEFLTTEYAHWGRGGSQDENDKPFTCLCTMLLGIRLLHYLGCPRIYLLGVDFWMEDGQQAYAFKQEKKARNGRYSHENEYLKELKPIFDKKGFEIYNCNPESKCDVFKNVSFEEALDDCRGGVPANSFDTENYYSKHIVEESIAKNPNPISIGELAREQRNQERSL